MRMMNKFAFIPCGFMLLIISACSDKSIDLKEIGGERITEEVIQSKGNLQAEKSEFSIQNKADIREDLVELNSIVDDMNSKSLVLREEIVNANKDPMKIDKILLKSNDIHQQGFRDLMSLTLKSSEINEIRIKIIDNLIISQKMFELSNEPNFKIGSPTAEFKSLSLQSQKLQLEVGKKLNRLNNKFRSDSNE